MLQQEWEGILLSMDGNLCACGNICLDPKANSVAPLNLQIGEISVALKSVAIASKRVETVSAGNNVDPVFFVHAIYMAHFINSLW